MPSARDQWRRAVVLLLVLLPLVAGATAGLALMAKKHAEASVASGDSGCRSRAAAGTVFDIDWCRAGAAAARGAASGLAAGAGARR